MSRAADVAEQAKAHGLQTAVPLLVTPGSEQVRAGGIPHPCSPSAAAVGNCFQLYHATKML
jgi:hypothetical protein